jgi:hypothetical protein
VVVPTSAYCRYGPGLAYLAAIPLYKDNHVLIQGRNFDNSWLWVLPDGFDRRCWTHRINLNITGDIMTLYVAPVQLPWSTWVYPPTGVGAMRNGNQVTISWDSTDNYITLDHRRGFLLEVNLCQNGVYFWSAVTTMNTSITFTDDQNCAYPSGGLLYIAEKHGYSHPVTIPWP